MELNDYIFEKIDDYLDGKMTEAQRSDFEQEVASQPELREAVDMVRFEKQAQEYLIAKDLRAQVDEWEKKPLPKEEKPDPPKSGGYKWIWGLLTIGLIAALLYFLTIPTPDDQPTEPKEPTQQINQERPVAEDEATPQQETDLPDENEKEEEVVENKNEPPVPVPNYEELYAYVETELYTRPSLFDDDGLKSPPEDGESIIGKGKKAFVAGEYEKAVKLLESIDPASSGYEAAKEPLAHAYFKNGQFAKAAGLFKEITDESTFLKDEPEWYWLLSLMADYGNSKATADSLLEKIAGEEGHGYRAKAQELKEKMGGSLSN